MPSPDFLAWGALALILGTGLVVLGWLLGMHEIDQRKNCEISGLRTDLAITRNLLARQRRLTAPEEERYQALLEKNKKLALRVAVASSPVSRAS